MTKATLDLTTTVAPEAVVNIDGKPYSLKTHLSTSESLHMRDLSEEVRELMERRGEARSGADDLRIVEINQYLVNACIDAPAEIVAKLPDEAKEKLLKFVTAEVKKRRDPTNDDGDSPPDSPDSTESVTG